MEGEVPKNYENVLREKYEKTVIDSILTDGKINEKEKTALKFLLELPPHIQKFYFEEKGLGENTINYLYSLSTLENRYAAENLLGDSPHWTPEYVWEYFKTDKKGIGVCVDAAAFFDSIYKSLGLASLPTEHWGIRKDNQKEEGHCIGSLFLYYIPTKQR